MSAGATVILTGTPRVLLGAPDGDCLSDAAIGTLVADRVFGTTIVTPDQTWPNPNFPGDFFHMAGGTAIVAWHPGYTGRWIGFEIEVRDPAGAVVATTGRPYALDGVSVDYGGSDWPGSADNVIFWACAAHRG